MTLTSKIWIGIIVAIGVLVLFPVLGHYRAKASVTAYRKQLQARGELLTPEELKPRITAEEQKSFGTLLAAINRLNSYELTNYPPAMRYVAPGKALVGWTEAVSWDESSSNTWLNAGPPIHAHENDLANLCAVLEDPVGSVALDYSHGFPNTLYVHLVATKKAAIWLSTATLVDLHEGTSNRAWADLKACVALTRLYDHEPLDISQLVRAAIDQIALNATWEALQYPGWKEDQLAELQTNWNSFNLLDELGPAMSMERAVGAFYFAQGRLSITNLDANAGSLPTMDDVGQALADPKHGLETLTEYPRYCGWKWYLSYREEIYNMQVWQAGLDSVHMLRTNGAFVPEMKRLDANLAQIDNLHSNVMGSFRIGLGAGMINTFMRKMANMESQRRLLVTAIALKRYQLREGKYPGQLQELVPSCLAELPLDLMDGKPLRYQPRPDGTFLLYSVGEDGVDDGGDPTSTQDAGVRNKQWVKGRDAVWPMPATAAETKAYEEKVIAAWRAKAETRDSFKKRAPRK